MQNARFAAAISRASEAYHISHNGNCLIINANVENEENITRRYLRNKRTPNSI